MRQVMVSYKVKPSYIGGSPLANVNAFQEFQRNIEDRNDAAPLVTGIEEIGSYRLVGDWRGH